jgi:hypothetical protein
LPKETDVCTGFNVKIQSFSFGSHGIKLITFYEKVDN